MAKFSKELYDEAIEDFTRAISLDPGLAAPYSNRGSAKHGKRLLDDAIADHTKAIELDPKSSGAYANRGHARRDKGLLREAREDYETALKLAPPHWKGRPIVEDCLRGIERQELLGEGNRLLESGKYRDAIRKYAEVVERSPSSKQAMLAAFNSACGYALLGEKPEALDWLEKAVEMGWKDAARLEGDSDLLSLHDEERYKKLIAKLKGE